MSENTLPAPIPAPSPALAAVEAGFSLPWLSLKGWFALMGGCFVWEALLGLPAIVFLPVLCGLLYLRLDRTRLWYAMGEKRLALEAARALSREYAGRPLEATFKVLEAAVLLDLRRLDAAKAVLAQVDPATLPDGPAKSGYFQVQGILYYRLGDVVALRAMTEAAEAELADRRIPRELKLLLENFRALADLLEGHAELASERLNGLSLKGAGRQVRGILLNNRAWFELRRKGDPERALEWSSQALALLPEESAVRNTFAIACLEAGRDPGPRVAQLETAVAELDTLPPQERPYVVFCAARAYLGVGDRGGYGAMRDLLRSMEGSGGFLDALGEGAVARLPEAVPLG